MKTNHFPPFSFVIAFNPLYLEIFSPSCLNSFYHSHFVVGLYVDIDGCLSLLLRHYETYSKTSSCTIKTNECVLKRVYGVEPGYTLLSSDSILITVKIKPPFKIIFTTDGSTFFGSQAYSVVLFSKELFRKPSYDSLLNFV